MFYLTVSASPLQCNKVNTCISNRITLHPSGESVLMEYGLF